jgi:uncharacterized protein (DUF1684 family)
LAREVRRQRAQRDDYFCEHSRSPVPNDEYEGFSGLNDYPIDEGRLRIPFRDETSGEETDGASRYPDLEPADHRANEDGVGGRFQRGVHPYLRLLGPIRVFAPADGEPVGRSHRGGRALLSLTTNLFDRLSRCCVHGG